MQMQRSNNNKRCRDKEAAPSTLQARYELEKVIGRGTFAKVMNAKHRLTAHKVAVKIFNRAKMKQHCTIEKVEREIEIMRFLKHPHIIRLYEGIVTDEHVYNVMELADSGQLYDYVVSHGKLHEGEARRVFQQIISGIAYCHRNMVVHRDLKMENILLDSGNNIKIADFGFSKFFSYNQLLRAPRGSPHYAAPELHEGRRYVGPEVDVWSCGVILYGILCGFLPFDDMNKSELKRKISSGNLRIPSNLSDPARDLVSSMLAVNPAKRITMDEVRKHRWLQLSIPHYLAIPPLDAKRQIIKIDEETVEQVVKNGFDRNNLVESLQNGVDNEATVVYYLILNERFDAPTQYFWTVYKETRGITQVDHAETYSRIEQLVPESKWTLGLEFHDCPREIMRKVAKVMQESDVFYTNSTYYKMRCARVPGVPSSIVRGMIQSFSRHGGVSSRSREIDNILERLSGAVFFEIQLYSAGEGNYMLDLKRNSGPEIQYMDLCSELVSRLRII